MSTATINALVISTGILDSLEDPWDSEATGNEYSSVAPDCIRLVKMVAQECVLICGEESISAKNIREKFGLT